MLALGNYLFHLKTSPYQKIQETTEYRFAALNHINHPNSIQALGPGENTLELEGVIYTEYCKFNQIDAMKQTAAKQEALILINETGYILGKYAISRIDETKTVFAANGTAKKIEFKLTLIKA